MQQYRMIILAAAATLLFPFSSQAQDSVLHLNFQNVVDAAIADGQLDGTVKFYLRGQKTRAIKKTFPEAVSNKKTNAFNKTDEEACAWTLRSVLISFQENAKKNGANAVVDLVSYYKKNEYKSSTQFECHAGAMMSGVAMKGKAAIVQ
ncbi:phosphoribosylglycinamide formyltransferase [Betaproteobacteria bacterium]|nr:phosphoribosylglycinamide formyltransferase [Betaproteobacteria bacterium]